MTLTAREFDLLIDMAENKLSDMLIVDREDVRERNLLSVCVGKLKELRGGLPRGRIAPQGEEAKTVIANGAPALA